MCKWSSDSFVRWTDSCLSSPISTSGVTSPSLSAQQLPCPQWNHLQFPCHTRRAITLTACHPLISCDKPNLGTVLSISTNYVFLFIYPTLSSGLQAPRGHGVIFTMPSQHLAQFLKHSGIQTVRCSLFLFLDYLPKFPNVPLYALTSVFFRSQTEYVFNETYSTTISGLTSMYVISLNIGLAAENFPN